MNKKYVYQHPLFGIGNFVQSTPAIQMLFDQMGKVPIYFENKSLEQLYAPWEKLEVLAEKPKNGQKMLCSSWVNYEKPDWFYQANLIDSRPDIPHTFVPPWNSINLPIQEPYAVVIRGMRGSEWTQLKDPGDAIYKHMLSALSERIPLVFIGTDQDYERVYNTMKTWIKVPIVSVKNNMLESVAAVRDAAFVISNDTGFYHVAGALKKPTFCLWKKTNWIKNNSPNPFEKVSFRWRKDFDVWFNEQMNSL